MIDKPTLSDLAGANSGSSTPPSPARSREKALPFALFQHYNAAPWESAPICGKKAGWFSEAHSECADSARQGSELVASQVSTAMHAGKSFSDLKPTIEQIKAKHPMLDSELRQAIMQSWNSAALEISTKEPLDDSRAAALRSFYEGAGLTTEESPEVSGTLGRLPEQYTLAHLSWESIPV